MSYNAAGTQSSLNAECAGAQIGEAVGSSADQFGELGTRDRVFRVELGVHGKNPPGTIQVFPMGC